MKAGLPMSDGLLGVVLRAAGVPKLTPAGGALLVWRVLGARAKARRDRRARLRAWAEDRRLSRVERVA